MYCTLERYDIATRASQMAHLHRRKGVRSEQCMPPRSTQSVWRQFPEHVGFLVQGEGPGRSGGTFLSHWILGSLQHWPTVLGRDKGGERREGGERLRGGEGSEMGGRGEIEGRGGEGWEGGEGEINLCPKIEHRHMNSHLVSYSQTLLRTQGLGNWVGT